MILNITWVFSLAAAVTWLRQCSLNPINGYNKYYTLMSAENYVRVNNVAKMSNEKKDIVSVLAAEFLFLIAGDHVFLPASYDEEEDFQLHKNAQIFGNLVTKLICTQQVYAIFNNTAQNIDVQTWNEPNDRHLFSRIFDHVVEELKNNSVLYEQFLFEKNSRKTESVQLAELHGQSIENKKRTSYDLPCAEILVLEQLLDNEVVKKVVLTIKLLMRSEEPLAEVPESAKMYRRRLETVKGLFKLATSGKNMEVKRRIQKIFDDSLAEEVRNCEIIEILGNRHQDVLCDLLLKKIENDDIVRDDFIHHLKTDLE